MSKAGTERPLRDPLPGLALCSVTTEACPFLHTPLARAHREQLANPLLESETLMGTHLKHLIVAGVSQETSPSISVSEEPNSPPSALQDTRRGTQAPGPRDLVIQSRQRGRAAR